MKKDEITIFLTENNVNVNVFKVLSNFAQNQIQERKSVNNNPLNDSIESQIPREEAHTVKSN